MLQTLAVVVIQASLVFGADDAPPSKDVEILDPKDRSLFVRNIPGVYGYTSNIYEIPMHPYPFVSSLCSDHNLPHFTLRISNTSFFAFFLCFHFLFNLITSMSVL